LEPTLANRRALAAVFRATRPRLLFAPYWEDAHPDHTAATRLVEEARFWSKLSKSDIPGEPFHPARILYYFSVHLRIVERPSLLLDVSDQLDAKVAALRCYRSQLVENQPVGRPGVIDSVCDRTRFWGQLAGVLHAEPFASREPVALRSLEHLLS
jgi:LmbE family N-acetylglucosaminyl deacetylase